jgi:hypothetical protein
VSRCRCSKSYQQKDGKNAVPPDDPGNATVDYHGEKRSNQTHASKTDPDAKMARKGKGKEAKHPGYAISQRKRVSVRSCPVMPGHGRVDEREWHGGR